MSKFIIIGSGFYGATIAERIANELDEEVLIIEKRDHIGGNSYSEIHKETGIEFHTYGTHIFHTSNHEVWNYINRFTEFNSYRHQVLTEYNKRVYQMPINLETINSFYKTNLKPYEVEAFLFNEISKSGIKQPKNFEEMGISRVGEALYKAFIHGYTKKQWGREPRELPAHIIQRLPFRTNYDESYYNSKWQGIPKDGYGEIFRKMLNHPKIKIELNTDYFKIKDELPKDSLIIYTGPIDKLFNYKYGHLEWRSLKFEFETKDYQDFQGTSVLNYANEEIPYTRIHEWKHLHSDREVFKSKKTLITKEFSIEGDKENPYYPIGGPRNQEILKLYQKEAAQLPNMIIGGRLGEYKYYDMHQTIEMALETFKRIRDEKK